jgi:hypothetical protein
MSWVATAVIGGAVIGGVASNIAADKQAGALAGAADSQAQATLMSTQMQLEFLRENRADVAEAVEAGLIDLDSGFNFAIAQLEPFAGTQELNAARGLLQDPSSLAERGSYKFALDQGTEAMQGAFSRTSGGGLSGRGIKESQRFGQNLASSALDAELNRLFPFFNLSAQANQNIGQFEAIRGSAKANLRLGGSTGQATVSGQYAPGIAAGIQNQGNIAANSLIQGSNLQTGLYSNLANAGTGMLNSLAINPNLFSSFNQAPAQTPVQQIPNMNYGGR